MAIQGDYSEIGDPIGLGRRSNQEKELREEEKKAENKRRNETKGDLKNFILPKLGKHPLSILSEKDMKKDGQETWRIEEEEEDGENKTFENPIVEYSQ